MAEIRDRVNLKLFINFLEKLGIEVHLNTKARGHYGYCSSKRIDISKDVPKNKIVDVLLHEFAHFIHFNLEPEIVRTNGSLVKLFDTDDTNQLENELFQITQIVFDSIQLRKFERLKENINEKIKEEKEKIKEFYPDFQSGKTFKEFEKFIKNSNAKYLLKYDCVLVKGGWFSHNVTISIKTIDDDFPNMPKAFSAYIKLKSYERKRNRINARNSRFLKYLKQPTELFARFFQFYCSDIDATKNLAPNTFLKFEKLKNECYYPFLNDFEKICLIENTVNDETSCLNEL